MHFDMLTTYNIFANQKVISYDASIYPCAEVQISVAFIAQVVIETVVFILKHPFIWVGY